MYIKRKGVEMEIFLIFLLGLGAGVLSGIFGIGGGVVIVPGLVYLFGFSQHKAQGTSLVALLLPVGILAVLRYYKAGQVEILSGLLLALGLFLGAYFGANVATSFPTLLLKRLFGGLFLIIAIRMLLGK